MSGVYMMVVLNVVCVFGRELLGIWDNWGFGFLVFGVVSVSVKIAFFFGRMYRY